MSAAPDPAGVPARRAALRLLDAVLRQGLPLEAALGNATRELNRPEDRALAHAIAAEAIRWLHDLDALIDSATKNRLADDAKARSVLRIALAQALRLGTPGHAAIATVLPLVDGGPKRLVHGVFGTLMRRHAALPERPTLPAAVEERWRSAWGEDAVDAASTLIAQQPPLDLSLKADAPEGLEGTSLAPGHLRLTDAGQVTALPGFEAGGWWVQDLAAFMPARLLGVGEGRTVLDLCAAPGGKALQLAAAGWAVTAVDISQSRLARLSDNLARTGLTARIVTADLMRWSPEQPADAVLLDAPCSATGIFRRHPEVLHRVRPAAIKELASTQQQMLERAADWTKPEGTLVYAVCSVEPEEGEAVATAFLDAHPDWTIVPPADGELPPQVQAHERGWVRLLPHTFVDVGGADSFFIARFRRRA